MCNSYFHFHIAKAEPRGVVGILGSNGQKIILMYKHVYGLARSCNWPNFCLTRKNLVCQVFRCYDFRNHKDELAYSGKKKHFVKSIVNSILGLFYIILVAPKGIYNIIKISKFPRHEKLTEDEKWLDLGLYVLATTVVISNPVIYSFLTPRLAQCTYKPIFLKHNWQLSSPYIHFCQVSWLVF